MSNDPNGEFDDDGAAATAGEPSGEWLAAELERAKVRIAALEVRVGELEGRAGVRRGPDDQG